MFAARTSGSPPRMWVVVTHILLLSVVVSGCAVFSTTSATSTRGNPAPTATVSNVVDGDTIVLRFATGQVETVRLLGIDTPETVDPTRPVQCFGTEASEYLARLLPEGTEVALERDVEARDRFGRLLAYIYRASDGLFVNGDMLQRGFADISIFEPNTAYQSDLAAAVTRARTRSEGLWDVCGGPDVPLDPSEYGERAEGANR